MENDQAPTPSTEPVDGGEQEEKVTLADLAAELHTRLSAMPDDDAAALARAIFDPTIAWAPRPDQDRYLVDD